MEARKLEPRDDSPGEVLQFPMRGERNQNPPGIGLWALLKEDLATHETLFVPGFWAVAINRIGNARMDIRSRLLRAPFSVLQHVLEVLLHWICRIELSYIVKIGRRVRFWHFGCSVIGARSIGDDVQIRHNVTLGLARHGDPIHAIPLIEDRVIIGAGVVILGPVRIGHDSVIGANAVVTRDVPPYSVVGGIPARVIKTLEPTQLETRARIDA